MAAERTLEDVRQYLRRTIGIERVVLFVKLAVIVFGLSVVVLGVGPLGSEDLPGAEPGTSQEVFFKSIRYFTLQLVLYAAANAIFWFNLFVLGRRISRYLFIKTTAFFLVIIDMLFVSLLIWLLPALQTSLFWLYCFVLIHAVLLFPDAATLGALTVLSGAFYAGAVTWNIARSQAERPLPYEQEAELAERSEQGRRAVMLHLVILGMVGGGCWGGNTLIQTRLRALVEAQERVIRTEKLNLAGMMATSIAHELKNPLAIMNNAAYILRRNQDALDPKLRRQVEIIASEIERSDKIIMELLGYTKLAGGKIDRVNVNRVLDDALEDLKNEIDTHRIVIAKSYAPRLPRLLIDRTQLRTLASNLLLNACEAIESLGRITVETGYTDDGFIEISITDTGKGILEENLQRVFDSLFTTKTSGGVQWPQPP
jgi:signal transduction histidine kinase